MGLKTGAKEAELRRGPEGGRGEGSAWGPEGGEGLSFHPILRKEDLNLP